MNSFFARIAQLWRTTTVRLTALFIAIFLIFSVILLGYIAFQVNYAIQRQQIQSINREIGELVRMNERRGIRSLASAVQQYSRRPGSGIYYLGDASGRMLVGNVNDFPIHILANSGQYTFDYDSEYDLENSRPRERSEDGHALVVTTLLNNGMRLIVGRDIAERRGFSAIILGGLGIGLLGIVVLSAFAGGITANRVVKRIDSISATSTKIMSGNMSERVPMTKNNDEFDELAHNLNNMLDRNEQLMLGLKEVTDNVAHDLKTPLTRLRNRAEAALRADGDDANHIEVLEQVIDESDQLIRTFNALLLIARVEAGTPSGAFESVSLPDVVQDIAELYEPVAEEQHVLLSVLTDEKLEIQANRELVGQALVNLIENALKYGKQVASENEAKGQCLPIESELPIASSIEVKAYRQNNEIVLEVCDNGPGIPESERTRVLERFVRLEKSRTASGSGLGLSLVSAVARLHKGTLVLEDANPGLCAKLVLPST